MSIEYTHNGTTTIISEVEPKHQCRLLELIGLSLKKPKKTQYQFTDALQEFTVLSPHEKREEIDVWIKVMENILTGRTCEKSKKYAVRDSHRV